MRDVALTGQGTKLPDGVPELPPGRFYRIRLDQTFSRPLLQVQIRERRRVGSVLLAKVYRSPYDYGTAGQAVTDACKAASEMAAADDRARVLSADIFSYEGDWEGIDR